MFTLTAFLALLAAPAVLAHPIEHVHVEQRSLGARWFHEVGHPAHTLFARQSNSTAPTPGSPNWAKQYPAGKATKDTLKPEWVDALNKAVSNGLIPTNVPVAKQSGGAAPSYSNSTGKMDPAKQPICSSSSQCKGDGQIYDVPDGIVALSFDDGPLPLLTEAFEVNGDDIAVHTWSHRYMTTLSNEEALAELAWTMQIIHDMTGGRVPRFWRPPYGDSDNRVRAIAREVLGLTTVIWNDDTNDWAITETPATQTVAGATKILQKAYSGPKSPGLCILEHELSDQSVSIFMDTFPLIAQNGWTAKSIPDAVGSSFYLNAADNTSPVTTVGIAQPVPTLVATTTTTASNSTSSGNSSSGSGSNSGSESSHSAALPNAAWPAWLSLAAVIPMSVALF
ncbi:chitin deacetylase [Rhizoctonia solani]|uniref:chitin deacetylase n=1 Tax=Rhizoctonia solani TaxID=456999 RepID=A0A8H8NP24_9AGAM|nr:chitin deacetylase [Rhizoctonia solani]QRW15891.1 chitin deacetylase [Rhizoctonia solani]